MMRRLSAPVPVSAATVQLSPTLTSFRVAIPYPSLLADVRRQLTETPLTNLSETR